MSKLIRVELTGVARSMSGTSMLELYFPAKATYRDVVEQLALLYPALVGVIIAQDHRSLLSAMIFNRNSEEETILPDMMDGQPEHGDRLLLTFFIVGG